MKILSMPRARREYVVDLRALERDMKRMLKVQMKEFIHQLEDNQAINRDNQLSTKFGNSTRSAA